MVNNMLFYFIMLFVNYINKDVFFLRFCAKRAQK